MRRLPLLELVPDSAAAADPVGGDRLRPDPLQPGDASQPALGRDRARHARRRCAARQAPDLHLRDDAPRADCALPGGGGQDRGRVARGLAGAGRTGGCRARGPAGPRVRAVRRHARAAQEPAPPSRRLRVPARWDAGGSSARRRRRARVADGGHADGSAWSGDALHHARRGVGRGARGALPALRGVRLSVARRGVRASRARGDGRRRGGADVESLLLARGRRRSGRVRGPLFGGRHRRRPRPPPRIARPPPRTVRARPPSCRRLHLGRHGRGTTYSRRSPLGRPR